MAFPFKAKFINKKYAIYWAKRTGKKFKIIKKGHFYTVGKK
jgi:hypothetical protein